MFRVYLSFILRIIVFGCLGGYLGGCSGQPENQRFSQLNDRVQTQPASKSIKFANSDQLNKFISELTIECEDCPKSLGVIFSKNDNQLGICNGIFLKKNLFVTSLHCLPESTRKIGSTCASSQILQVGSSKKLLCKKVVDRSVQDPELTVNRPDFVALEIEASEVEFQESRLNTASIDNESKYFVWANDRKSESSAIIKFEKRECTLIRGSVINPFFTDTHRATYGAKACLLNPGDSGSPLFNSKGDVIGLHSQLVRVPRNSEYYLLSEKVPEKNTNTFSRGTLASCFNSVLDPSFETPRECLEVYSESREMDQVYSIKKDRLNGVIEERNEKVQAWLKSHTQVFFFELGQVTYENPVERAGVIEELQVEIQCVRPRFKSSADVVDHELESWKTVLFYDQNLSPDYRFESLRLWGKVEFKDLKIDDQAHYLWIKQSDSSRIESPVQSKPWCKY